VPKLNSGKKKDNAKVPRKANKDAKRKPFLNPLLNAVKNG
jgi:hypothetical protein